MKPKGKAVSALSPQELETETTRLARDLCLVIRAPVNIQLVGGSHIAFTFPGEEDEKAKNIHIIMNPSAIEGIRNRERALQVWRGIGYHEVFHHLWPAVPQYKKAYAEGFKDLYNLIDDEQNERRGRSLNPEWGAALQSVVAHVFNRKTRFSKELPKGMTHSDQQRRRPARGLAAHIKYAERFNLFAFHFRRQVEEQAPDPIVAEALALIPRRLKDLNKEELLDLTRQVHAVLSRGLELPPPPPLPEKPTEPQAKDGEGKEGKENEGEENEGEEKQSEGENDEQIDDGEPDVEEAEEEEKNEEENKDGDKSDDEESDEKKDDEEEGGAGEDDDEDESTPQKESKKDKGSPFSLKKVLKSKPMMGIGLLFVLFWTYVLVRQAGVNFWFQLAIFAGITLAIVGGFLWMRRAFIKKLLKELAASPGAVIRPPAGVKPKAAFSSRRFVVLASLAVAFLLYEIVPKMISNPLAGLFMLAFLMIAGSLGYAMLLRAHARHGRIHPADAWVKLLLPFVFIGCFVMLLVMAAGSGSFGLISLLVAFLGGSVVLSLLFWLLCSKVQPAAGAGTTHAGTSGHPVGWEPSDFWPRLFRGVRTNLRRARRWTGDKARQGRGLLWRGIKAIGALFGAVLGFVFVGLIWKFIAWICPIGWRALVKMAKAFWAGVCWLAEHIWEFIVFVATNFWKFITWAATTFWFHLRRFARWLRMRISWGYWKLEPYLMRAWRNPVLRLFILALPMAIIAAMIYAVLYMAGKFSIWLLIILLILLLLLLLLGFLNRKKIARFVVQELFIPMPDLMQYMMRVPLDMTTEWFNRIDNIVPVNANPVELESVMQQVDVLGQELRPYFQRCGMTDVDIDDQPEGFDLTDEAELALVGETSIFVNDEKRPKASVHIEVAVDCSGSMGSATKSLKAGQKFQLAKFFALVLERAVVGLPGVTAHFWGFDGDTIYDCGVPGEGRITGLLAPGGGNNDSAMLWHMGQSAAESKAEVKILFMLSDGMPAECSWLSLHNLVLQFEQEGMIPWQIALDVIPVPAFENYVTDLVGQSLDQAIVTMQETVAQIADQL